ncbi:MAG: hypothetical protein ABJZ69_00245 [Hyphomicrobiales bacterium]
MRRSSVAREGRTIIAFIWALIIVRVIWSLGTSSHSPFLSA